MLIGSGTASAALVGLAVGTALSWTPRAGIGVVAALAIVAVVADGIHMRAGRPSPWSVGRQVPVEWGRMFDPRVVAVLYGPRLGVGPLTMLSTWIWWAATIGAALVGIAESVIVATVFGLVRLVVTATASDLADRTGHATWFARLRRRTTVAWWSLDGATMALMGLVVVIAAACSSNTSIEAGPEEPSSDTLTTTTTNPGTDAVIEQDADDRNEPGDDADASTPTTDIFTESSLAETSTPLVTTADDIEPRPPAGPAALAAVLIDEVAGFEPVADAEGDRQLSIDDAAQLQPDPTEELPLLETRGYQGGWTRAFRNDDNDVIVATVYDFISELEADFYLEDGTITLIGDGSTIYEVEAIPGARGFEQQILGGGEPLVVYGITFTNANQWFLVTILGDPATATPDRLLPAAVAQYQASRS